MLSKTRTPVRSPALEVIPETITRPFSNTSPEATVPDVASMEATDNIAPRCLLAVPGLFIPGLYLG